MASLASGILLPLLDYQRYGRQMILDGIGLTGQVKLRSSSVIIVGAGGLGCPALQYIAAAGVGRIGIVDDDCIELSNLQRQILHSEDSVGSEKAQSAANSIKKINSSLKVDIVTERLTSQNAISILKPYDIILDCTDNAPTRYLLSDAAVVLGKPLVSGAAQKFDGQLCVYNLGSDGPCYRCLFPKPPSQEMSGSCEETGILGAVTGVIGNLQALETIKLIVGLHDKQPSMLVFSALGSPPFRSVKLRSRRNNCIACGTKDFSLDCIEQTDYIQMCGGPRPDWVQLGLLGNERRVKVTDLNSALESKEQTINLIDVRPPTEFGICHLPDSKNVPLSELLANPEPYLPQDTKTPTYVVCRLGNDSQIAADALHSLRPDSGNIYDVIGGLRAWSKEIDGNFPIY